MLAEIGGRRGFCFASRVSPCVVDCVAHARYLVSRSSLLVAALSMRTGCCIVAHTAHASVLTEATGSQ